MKAFLQSKKALAFALALGVALCGFAFANQNAEAKPAKKRGWIGVSVQELTPSLRDAMKLGNRTGLLINEVVEGSPAEDAGLQEEDVLLEFNGEKVERTKRLSMLVRNTEPRTEVEIKIFRDGEESTVKLTVGRLKTSRAGVYSFGKGDNNVFFVGNRPMLGVHVHELDDDLAAYFKVDKNDGVLVLNVEEDSPAEKAGMKAGDVILTVDGDKIRDYDELIEVLSYYEDGEEVKVEYIRQGRKNEVAIELEARGNSSWGFTMPRGQNFDWNFFEHDGNRIHFSRPGIHKRILERDLHDLKDRIQDERARYRIRIRNNVSLKTIDSI